MKTWLLDTGPVISYLDTKDPAHGTVVSCLDAFIGELCTTDAVMVEAMHLVAEAAHGPALVADFAEADELKAYTLSHPSQLREAAGLMRRYADIPVDFADAILVILSDQLNAPEIVTLDRRGFSTYRSGRGEVFRLVLDQP